MISRRAADPFDLRRTPHLIRRSPIRGGLEVLGRRIRDDEIDAVAIDEEVDDTVIKPNTRNVDASGQIARADKGRSTTTAWFRRSRSRRFARALDWNRRPTPGSPIFDIDIVELPKPPGWWHEDSPLAKTTFRARHSSALQVDAAPRAAALRRANRRPALRKERHRHELPRRAQGHWLNRQTLKNSANYQF
ncbi:hypothetical protein [Streptomyces sp. NBC_00503]|uniref:hypothetical protein n=1 Tax=Streptomyces sp. NBC_00503 TaxID=2903659 RepID=UPI002E7FD502|nr:hypothetical protein [Streptomyces sp. NBC_00503]WUD85775.1 hypothetical protein OG490_37410 [Streptomyces sp. NBC_00503]